MVIVRRLTRTMRSLGQRTQIKPGPLGSGYKRPSRKITPRSYSRRTFRELNNQVTRMTTGTSNSVNWSIAILSGERAAGADHADSRLPGSFTLQLRLRP